MNLRFGASVAGRDGDGHGTLQRVVYDPATRQVTALVAGGGEDEVIVPIGAIVTADAGGVTVELSPQQWDGLDPYVASEQNIAPPPHVDASDVDHITEPVDVPEVVPVGAATGVESIAFTPIIEETTNVSEVDQVLDGTTAIWATDADVGTLVEIQVSDETNRVQAIIFGGPDLNADIEVPADDVGSIQSGAVILTLDRAALQAIDHD